MKIIHSALNTIFRVRDRLADLSVRFLCFNKTTLYGSVDRFQQRFLF